MVMSSGRPLLLSFALAVFAAAGFAQLPNPSVEPEPKSELAADLLTAQTSFEVERDRLYLELAATVDAAQRLRLQRELEQLKVRAELRLLQIQLDHARQQGNAEVVAQLEPMIEAAKSLQAEGAQ
jgi:hypothetical protein